MREIKFKSVIKARREKEKLEQEKAEQMNNVQDNTTVTALEKEVFETSITEEEDDDDNWASHLCEEDYMNSVLYDSEDDPVDSSFYNPSETGWEHHPCGGLPVGTVRKPMF